jgi:hypothetical protein
MLVKRFIVLSAIVVSYSAFSGGITVQTEFVSKTLRNESTPVDLVEKMTISTKEVTVVIEKTDAEFRKWKVTGPDYDGAIELFISNERGIGWLFKFGEDSLKAVIARDYRTSGSPGLITITTNFFAGLYILENRDGDCNGNFAMYSLKNSWEADVEYTGDYAFEMFNYDPCVDGQWKIRSGKLKMVRKIQFAGVFVAATSNNIKHLFRDYVLE